MLYHSEQKPAGLPAPSPKDPVTQQDVWAESGNKCNAYVTVNKGGRSSHPNDVRAHARDAKKSIAGFCFFFGRRSEQGCPWRFHFFFCRHSLFFDWPGLTAHFFYRA